MYILEFLLLFCHISPVLFLLWVVAETSQRQGLNLIYSTLLVAILTRMCPPWGPLKIKKHEHNLTWSRVGAPPMRDTCNHVM